LSQAKTQVWRLNEVREQLQQFRAAVSLHSHTCHSKEKADFIPAYYQRIPGLNRIIASRLKRYQERTGTAIDFRRIYWTPPVLPRTVLASETSQIEQKLNLPALVSITDHDTIAAPLSLRERAESAFVPISLEWSVPFRENVFHIGVHNLPPASSVEIVNELARYTAQPDETQLADLLTLLGSFPETLLILNHPYFDFGRLGAVRHRESVREFVSRIQPLIHALELGGMRPWRESQEVLCLAAEYDLPIVGGGDRHGCRPNGILNLSRAEGWGEFVSRIRMKKENDVLVLPACEEPVCFRELQIVADVSRFYPSYPYGYRQFTDRIFVDLEGYSWHRLSFYWSGGMPLWLRPVFGGLAAMGDNPVRGLLRRTLGLFGDHDLATWPTRAGYSSEAVSFEKGVV
jgi:hypothetical protein